MRITPASFVLPAIATIALALGGCSTMSGPSALPSTHTLSPSSGGVAGGGGAAGGGGGVAGGGGGGVPAAGGGGGVNFGLSGKFTPDPAFPNTFGNFRVQRTGNLEKLSGDVVQTGLPGSQIVNNVENSTWVLVSLNGAPYMVTSVITSAEFGGTLPKVLCPDVTNTSTDCAPIAQELNRAPGGVVVTVPALVAGSRLDFSAVDGTLAPTGVSLFDPSVPVIGHLGFVVLK
jgi:hypothetical protein